MTLVMMVIVMKKEKKEEEEEEEKRKRRRKGWRGRRNGGTRRKKKTQWRHEGGSVREDVVKGGMRDRNNQDILCAHMKLSKNKLLTNK